MSYVYWVHLKKHTDILSEGYVGITEVGVKERFSTHLKESKSKDYPIHKAIRKYGDELIVTTVCQCSTDYALFLEAKLRPSEKIGWNLVRGGGLPPSHKGKKRSTEFIQKLKERMKNSTFLSEYNKTHKTVITDETKLKISNTMKGRSLSQETKQRMTEVRSSIEYRLSVCNQELLRRADSFYRMYLDGVTPNRTLATEVNVTRQSLKTLWRLFEDGYIPNSVSNLDAGDYLELMYAVADTAIELQALPATAFSPAAPSVLIHITQVNQ